MQNELKTKTYIVYCYTILSTRSNKMSAQQKNEEIRWQVIKAMLEEFPTLKQQVKAYLKKHDSKQ